MTAKLKRFFLPFTGFLLLMLLSSCGYHMGSMMHPQIKTVAIAEVRNETREVLASAIMRKQIAERFQFDNSLKISSVGLVWPTDDVVFDNLWKATLNRSCDDVVKLKFSHKSTALILLD